MVAGRTDVLPSAQAPARGGHARRAGLDTREHFILGAYADFLREEGLMDDALTTSHALALEHHAGAEQVLTRLCQLVDPNVEDRWGEREDQHKSYRKVKYEQGWWATYPLQRRGGAEPPSTWRGAFPWVGTLRRQRPGKGRTQDDGVRCGSVDVVRRQPGRHLRERRLGQRPSHRRFRRL